MCAEFEVSSATAPEELGASVLLALIVSVRVESFHIYVILVGI